MEIWGSRFESTWRGHLVKRQLRWEEKILCIVILSVRVLPNPKRLMIWHCVYACVCECVAISFLVNVVSCSLPLSSIVSRVLPFSPVASKCVLGSEISCPLCPVVSRCLPMSSECIAGSKIGGSRCLPASPVVSRCLPFCFP